LRFIGEVDAHMQRDVESALDQIEAPAFDLRFVAAGQFGNDRPRALWSGVEDAYAVSHLAKKIEAALQRLGLEPERRKFSPHVTLAYLKGARRGDVDTYIGEHADFKSDTFSVDRFVISSAHTIR
jgi:2'-5' RNA ligase